MSSTKRSLSGQTQYLPFKPSWLNKLRSPIQSSGYYVLLSRNAQETLDKLNPFQRLIISQYIYSLSSNPIAVSTSSVRNRPGSYSIAVRNSGFLITYSVESGKVFVLSISTR